MQPIALPFLERATRAAARFSGVTTVAIRVWRAFMTRVRIQLIFTNSLLL